MHPGDVAAHDARSLGATLVGLRQAVTFDDLLI
jgi:hypothetical protein